MAKLLTDDEVFGGAAGSGLLSDDEVFGAKKKDEKPSGDRPYLLKAVSNIGGHLDRMAGGVLQTIGGVGSVLQAPGESARSMLLGGLASADRLVASGLNAIGPEGTQVTPNATIQAAAQTAAADAVAQRRKNIDIENDSALVSPRTLLARIGGFLQEDSRERIAQNNASIEKNYPEMVAAEREVAQAEGFGGKLAAMAQNPMGVTSMLAQSAPAMALGVGASATVARSTMGAAGKAADLAAARVAAAGGDLGAQTAAAKAAIDAVGKTAVARASAVGTGSEAITQGEQGRESIYQEVMNLPADKLMQSPRYQQLLAANRDPMAARETLANEVADQTVALSAGGTALGSKIINSRMFGGDTTAKAIVGAEKLTARDVLANTFKEGAEEELQAIPQTLAEHAAKVQADPSAKMDMGGALAENMVAGHLMGGAGTGARYTGQRIQDYRQAPANAAAGQDAEPVAAEEVLGVEPVAAEEVLGVEPAPAAAPVVSDAEKDLLQPRMLTTLDRVNEIDAALPTAPEADREALQAERANLTKDWPSAVPGASTTFSTEDGARLGAQYALMEVTGLQTSHDEDLRRNPVYPQELQPRERDRAASEMQVQQITQKLDPARLGLSADSANGAPIVGADGLVESGNARTIALKRIYKVPGQKASEYRGWLRENAAQFGLQPEQVDGMTAPVLVRVRTTPVNRAEFARQANASTVAAMSPVEQARADAKRIDDMGDLTPDDNGDFATSRDFIRRFMARMPITEQGGMVDADGRLSSAGYARVRNAVLAKAYGDSPILTRMVESMDDSMRNLSKALMIAAPRVARAREAIGAGALFDADITPHLVEAAQELGRLKDAGTSVQDALAQVGLMGDTYSPETREMLQFLSDNARRPRRMAEFVRAYFDALEAAGDPRQGGMFGEPEAPAKTDLMTAARRETEGAQDAAIPAKDTQRGVDREAAPAGEGPGQQSAPAQGDQVGARGDGPAGTAAEGRQAGQVVDLNAQREAAVQEFKDAAADLAQILTKHTRAAMVKESTPDLMPTLIRLFEKAIKIVGTDLKRATAWVKQQLKADPELKPHWNKVGDDLYRKAALEAINRAGSGDMIGVAMIDGRPYDPKFDNFDKRIDLPRLLQMRLAPEVLQAARGFVDRYFKSKPEPDLSAENRAKAEDILRPMLEKAAQDKVGYDQKIIDIAQRAGALGQMLAPLKNIKRGAEKLAIDEKFNPAGMKDLLRSTIVVDSYDDAAKVIDEIRKEFRVMRVVDRAEIGLQGDDVSVKKRAQFGGYADVLVNVFTENGTVAEIQINTPVMMAAKDGDGHKLYEAARIQPDESELRAEINSAMSILYEAAFSDAKSGGSLRSQMPPAGPSFMSGRGSSSEPSSENLNQPSPGIIANQSPPKVGTNLLPGGNLSGTFIASSSNTTVSQNQESVHNTGTGGDPNATSNGRKGPAGPKDEDPAADTKLSRGAGGGIDLPSLKAVADRISKAMPGMPRVHSLASPTVAAVPKALRKFIEARGAMGDVEGAFHAGEIYLFASGIVDEARAEHVLAEHEAAHAGLAGLLGAGKARAMQAIANQNPAVRKAATARVAQGVSLAEAVEEVLVDIPSRDLARLKGWRALVGKVRDAFKAGGFDRLAAQIDRWLAGHLTEQQKADLFVADLVREARAFVAKPRGGRTIQQGATALSDGKLSDDLAAQEAWLTREAKGRGYKDIEDLLERNYPLFEKLAALWRQKNPASVLLSRGKIADVNAVNSAAQQIADAIAAEKNSDPFADYALRALPGESSGVKPGDVLDASFRWDDGEQTDDRIDGTSAIKIDEPHGVAQVLKALRFAGAIGVAPHETPNGIYDGNTFALIKGESTGSGEDAGEVVISDATVVSTWARSGQWRGIVPNDQSAPTSSGARLSRAAVAGSTPAQTASERAEAIIQTSASTPKPLDAAAKLLTRVTGIEKVARVFYGLGGRLIDRLTPETVKAGIVSDYGVPEAVIDQRAMMEGRQREHLRQVGVLLSKLSTMTRAESRVAYEWMNMDGTEDPRAYVSMMQGLPEESVKVLQEVQDLIDSLSKEAVRLGLLDPEAFKRHRFAYLRRSYFKHVVEMKAGDVAKRQRVISILGEQYKGRGMVAKAAMRQIQNIAPEWWQRKMVAGKADTALKGEKFIRLEKRVIVEGNLKLVGATSSPTRQVRLGLSGGEGVKAVHVGSTRKVMVDSKTAQIEGVSPAIGQRTKIEALVYWPAAKAVPVEYSEWDNAGTWEVRDVKGADAVMWRDFTKEEREKMGEIDEARYAIAKTLHSMIHDVEVGRYLEWLAKEHALKEGQEIPGVVVEASERYKDTFKPGEWVQVPESKIKGTSVQKYGLLAGRYVPGPIWNDLRQVVGGRFQPLGETYDKILKMWKASKTALSPAVHMNNIMSNFVMADWHDVSAGHVQKALRILLGALERDGTGAIGRAGNLAARLGIGDREAAQAILTRYQDSGGSIGGWLTQEIANDQLEPIVEALKAEIELKAADAGGGEVGVYSALQHLLHARFGAAWEAAKGSKPGQAIGTEGKNLLALYSSEDDVFRLAAWLKAKEEGKTDLEAGKVSRRSFLDYSINAPWVQAARQTALPFISFTYRALPMLLHTAGTKPHKLMKLMALAGALNWLGVMLGGGGDDRERKLLPEEKAGRVWGLVPKLIRMPWNDKHGSPVYLDIRRWIPVGDVADLGQGHSALPIPPSLLPGGPLAMLGEVVFNKSMFTGKAITLETDTGVEATKKIADYLWKAAMPNVAFIPGTYAWSGISDSLSGRTDTFGRDLSPGMAAANTVGVKLGAYPADVLRRNLMGKANAEIAEIEKNVADLKRQRRTNRITAEELSERIREQVAKEVKVRRELAEKMR